VFPETILIVSPTLGRAKETPEKSLDSPSLRKVFLMIRLKPEIVLIVIAGKSSQKVDFLSSLFGSLCARMYAKFGNYFEL
jgi:hypothetical protein